MVEATRIDKSEKSISEASIYNLSAKLFTPETLFEEQISPQQWVVFAPDFEGRPVTLSSNIHQFLDAFRNGNTVADVLAQSDDFILDLANITALVERGFLREAPVKLPYPIPSQGTSKDLSVWLHITNSCNLKCSYCFVGEKTNDGMDEEAMKKVARNIAQTANLYGTEQVDIKFAGGEATLFIDRMVQFRAILCEEMLGSGVTVNFGILSNGTVVTDRLISFLKETNTSISISLDGYGAAHDIYRVYQPGRGSWDIISRNIKKLCESGIKPYILGTISQETCDSLPDLVRWIFEHGLRCRLSVVRQPNCSWDGSTSRDLEYKQMNAKLAEAFDKAFTVLEDPSIFIDLRNGLELCELSFERPTNGSPCGIAQNHIVIKPNGNLVSCPMTIAEDGISSSGDLFKTAKETFAYSPSERQFLQEEDDCLHCKWFGVCSGGCPITNLRIKGHAYTRSPLCSFYKAVIPRYLKFFGKKLLQSQALAELTC